jgi:hypothetical protein
MVRLSEVLIPKFPRGRMMRRSGIRLEELWMCQFAVFILAD